MLQYLGQILDSQGVRKDLSKVKAIVGMTEPKDTGDLRRFLGLVSHLMKFAPIWRRKRSPYETCSRRKRLGYGAQPNKKPSND